MHDATTTEETKVTVGLDLGDRYRPLSEEPRGGLLSGSQTPAGKFRLP